MVCNSLRNNKSLLSLDLRWNSLGPRGANFLKSSLINNQTILYLDLNGNNVSEEAQDALEKLVLENRRRNPITRDRIFAGPNVPEPASISQMNMSNGNAAGGPVNPFA